MRRKWSGEMRSFQAVAGQGMVEYLVLLAVILLALLASSESIRGAIQGLYQTAGDQTGSALDSAKGAFAR